MSVYLIPSASKFSLLPSAFVMDAPPAPPPSAPKRRPGRPSLWDEVKDAMMRAEYAFYRAARRLKVLAEMIGCTLSCLYQRAKRAGLSVKQVKKPKVEKPKRLTKKALARAQAMGIGCEIQVVGA